MHGEISTIEKKPITSSTIRVALEKRYAAPEWCLMHEVANGTGSAIRRYADCIAMNLFPSRGLSIHGLEIKVSRRDLINELKTPHKADEIAQYCDYWFVVCPKGMADGLELPMSWGLIELHENGILREKKKAEKLEAKPLTRSFIAALARRISQLDAATIAELAEERIKPERERLTKEAEKLYEERKKYPRDLADKYSELKKQLEGLETAVGFKIDNGWNGFEDFIKAAELVRRCGIDRSYSGIIDLRNTIRSKLKAMDESLSHFGIEDKGAA